MNILNPFSLCKRVSFDYFGSIDEGVCLLSKYVIRPSFSLKFDDGLLGKTSIDKIEIWLHRPYSRNFLIPVFSGKFINENGKTVLSGEFRLQRGAKVTFVVGIISIMAYWSYVAIVDYKELIDKSMLMTPLWCCIGNIIFMIIALYGCRYVSRKDMKTIEEQISKILKNGFI